MFRLPGDPLLPCVVVSRGEDAARDGIDFGDDDMQVGGERVGRRPGLHVFDDEGGGYIELELPPEGIDHCQHLRRGRRLGGGDDEMAEGEASGVTAGIVNSVAQVLVGPSQDPDLLVLVTVPEVSEEGFRASAPRPDADGLDDHLRLTQSRGVGR
ncbi:hypothetical protein G3T14_03060 [Methylobacterium sp. BTF04]|uniref:hypothetical protein n=1 Tax=Methylobacterium sp. BTF04 TaxID=2708300 RepID=UPI0013D50638|nr:hypothetical protein [Methylobacterium sp. BTF04]NEU11109.1 hypothetical protein [Methylobacterium sp. BTF04]